MCLFCQCHDVQYCGVIQCWIYFSGTVTGVGNCLGMAMSFVAPLAVGGIVGEKVSPMLEFPYKQESFWVWVQPMRDDVIM